MIACYLGLYEEGEVEHINGVWPNSYYYQLLVVIITWAYTPHAA